MVLEARVRNRGIVDGRLGRALINSNEMRVCIIIFANGASRFRPRKVVLVRFH